VQTGPDLRVHDQPLAAGIPWDLGPVRASKSPAEGSRHGERPTWDSSLIRTTTVVRSFGITAEPWQTVADQVEGAVPGARSPRDDRGRGHHETQWVCWWKSRQAESSSFASLSGQLLQRMRILPGMVSPAFAVGAGSDWVCGSVDAGHHHEYEQIAWFTRSHTARGALALEG
jgi:hypothetical protein